MKGLELAEAYFHEHGLPMLRAEFPGLLPHLAAGLVGSGSECMGYDDEISTDHDFEPGFCLFLPDEEVVDSRIAFRLERAYAALPSEFHGYRRAPLSPVGGNRHGVIRLSEFLLARTGSPTGEPSLSEWLALPEQSLLEVTNGKVFYDGPGLLTAARRRLSYLPEDARLKRLAGHVLLAGQAGQYNYPRCLLRGDTAAAQLSVIEFSKSILAVIFLLNATYAPYYKWCFRAARELPILGDLTESLEYLISSPNTGDVGMRKRAMCEEIAARVAVGLCEGGVSDFAGEVLEGHAYAVNSRICDGALRNLPILYGV